MQIEFHLPLPTLDSLIGFAIIWYMLGLVVTTYYVAKWDLSHRNAITWRNLNLVTMMLLSASSWFWPILTISYHRNR